MKSVVPDEVIERCNNCHHNFSGLETGESCCACEVDHAHGKDILVLRKRSLEVAFCSNYINFGGQFICLCPVHYHLYSFCR